MGFWDYVFSDDHAKVVSNVIALFALSVAFYSLHIARRKDFVKLRLTATSHRFGDIELTIRNVGAVAAYLQRITAKQEYLSFFEVEYLLRNVESEEGEGDRFQPTVVIPPIEPKNSRSVTITMQSIRDANQARPTMLFVYTNCVDDSALFPAHESDRIQRCANRN